MEQNCKKEIKPERQTASTWLRDLVATTILAINFVEPVDKWSSNCNLYCFFFYCQSTDNFLRRKTTVIVQEKYI